MSPSTVTSRDHCAMLRSGDVPDLKKDHAMRPLYRKPVNKRRSANTFRKHSRRTKARNMITPMRGGIRA